jgi:hypothetical protein
MTNSESDVNPLGYGFCSCEGFFIGAVDSAKIFGLAVAAFPFGQAASDRLAHIAHQRIATL